MALFIIGSSLFVGAALGVLFSLAPSTTVIGGLASTMPAAGFLSGAIAVGSEAIQAQSESVEMNRHLEFNIARMSITAAFGIIGTIAGGYVSYAAGAGSQALFKKLGTEILGQAVLGGVLGAVEGTAQAALAGEDTTIPGWSGFAAGMITGAASGGLTAAISGMRVGRIRYLNSNIRGNTTSSQAQRRALALGASRGDIDLIPTLNPELQTAISGANKLGTVKRLVDTSGRTLRSGHTGSVFPKTRGRLADWIQESMLFRSDAAYKYRHTFDTPIQARDPKTLGYTFTGIPAIVNFVSRTPFVITLANIISPNNGNDDE